MSVPQYRRWSARRLSRRAKWLRWQGFVAQSAASLIMVSLPVERTISNSTYWIIRTKAKIDYGINADQYNVPRRPERRTVWKENKSSTLLARISWGSEGNESVGTVGGEMNSTLVSTPHFIVLYYRNTASESFLFSFFLFFSWATVFRSRIHLWNNCSGSSC